MSNVYIKNFDRLPKGARVRHEGASSRNGWTGTVVHIGKRTSHDSPHDPKFRVVWDQMPQYRGERPAQPYSRQALRTKNNPEGYIVVFDLPQDETELDDDDATPCVVMGSDGGRPERVRGYQRALKVAEERAAQSRSGQAYLVLTAADEFRRQDPPVVHTQIKEVLHD